MKLSKALLKGSKGRNQCFNQRINDSGAVCAIGAIGIGVGGDAYARIHNAFPELFSLEFYKDIGVCDLYTAIIAKNDQYRWSFSRIAAWLKRKGL